MSRTATLPQAFVWRRLHSLLGLWLVLFLMEHLLVNSQAALLLGENAKNFVNLVNSIHNLPFLEAIEIFLLGVPILIHLIWGLKRLFTAKSNSRASDGSKPSLPQYARNHAYTWQRITSWILVFMLIGHVVKFRFLEYPTTVEQGREEIYLVKVGMDNGLYTLSHRLDATLYNSEQIGRLGLLDYPEEKLSAEPMTITGPEGVSYDPDLEKRLSQEEDTKVSYALIQGLKHYQVKEDQVVVACSDFGTASLLAVRDTFKNPIYVFLYTIFVLAACFHAFNGFWTFLITWGVVLRMASQKSMGRFAVGLMILVTILGLAAIWGTYFVNLRT